MISVLLNNSMTMVLLLTTGSLMKLFCYMNIGMNMLMSNQWNNNKKMNVSMNMMNYLITINFSGFISMLL